MICFRSRNIVRLWCFYPEKADDCLPLRGCEAVYNDIRKFSETLKQNIADGNYPYIVISYNAINIIYDDNIEAMIRALDDFVSKNINTTSWQIAMNVFVDK